MTDAPGNAPNTSPRPARTTARRRTLSQAIAEDLASRIRAGAYGPGDALPTERALMDEFGVGRSSARESMQALATMGLIDIRPGRGARVLAVSSRHPVAEDLLVAMLEGHAVEDLYEFRRSAEVEVAGLAAERATDEDRRQIRQSVAAYRRAVREGIELAQADGEFHRALAVASHNIVFENVLGGLMDLLNFARREVMTVPWVPSRALREHAEIAKAVSVGDSEAARRLMRIHIEGAIEAVKETRLARPLGEEKARE